MSVTAKDLSIIFEKEPESWGLRGHPYLWEDLKNNLSDLDWPASEEELQGILEEKFLELTGASITQDGDIFLEKYSHGGMSGGYIDIPYWHQYHFPMILKRFHQENLEEQMSQFVKATITGSDFTLYLGDVDLKKEIVTIQLDMSLVAAVQDRGDGKLLTSNYRPLCEKSVRYLIDLSVTPNDDGSVGRRSNNWEYALDCSAGTGNVYASKSGEAYLSYWKHGLGILPGEEDVSEWTAQQELKPFPKEQVEKYFSFVKAR